MCSCLYLFWLQGQTESKKRSRSVETKGTAMSFGFRKKLPAQKRNLNDGTKDSSKQDLNSTNGNTLKIDNACCIGDNNGNSGEFAIAFVARPSPVSWKV